MPETTTTHTNAENFVKIVQTSCPRGANSWQKLQILTVLGSSVGRISEWEGFRSRRRGGGGWAVPPPQTNLAFFASKSHVCDAL